MVSPGESQPLARIYRLGAWYDSETFANERSDNYSRLNRTAVAGTMNPLIADPEATDQLVWVGGEGGWMQAGSYMVAPDPPRPGAPGPDELGLPGADHGPPQGQRRGPEQERRVRSNRSRRHG